MVLRALDCCSILSPLQDQFKSRIQMAMKSILKNQNLVLGSYMKKSIKVVDSLKFKTQKEKIVYGGGGIVPDVLCP
jgi:hypothetical protein